MEVCFGPWGPPRRPPGRVPQSWSQPSRRQTPAPAPRSRSLASCWRRWAWGRSSASPAAAGPFSQDLAGPPQRAVPTPPGKEHAVESELHGCKQEKSAAPLRCRDSPTATLWLLCLSKQRRDTLSAGAKGLLSAFMCFRWVKSAGRSKRDTDAFCETASQTSSADTQPSS